MESRRWRGTSQLGNSRLGSDQAGFWGLLPVGPWSSELGYRKDLTEKTLEGRFESQSKSSGLEREGSVFLQRPGSRCWGSWHGVGGVQRQRSHPKEQGSEAGAWRQGSGISSGWSSDPWKLAVQSGSQIYGNLEQGSQGAQDGPSG